MSFELDLNLTLAIEWDLELDNTRRRGAGGSPVESYDLMELVESTELFLSLYLPTASLASTSTEF